MKLALPWYPMGATWASATPLRPLGYTFALALFELLHALGADYAADDRGPISAARIGLRTRLTAEESEAGLAELIDARVAVSRDDGAIGCPGWREAQLSDPKRAERNRRHRERKKASRVATPRDVSRDGSKTRKASLEENENKRKNERREPPPSPSLAAGPGPAHAAPVQANLVDPGPRIAAKPVRAPGRPRVDDEVTAAADRVLAYLSAKRRELKPSAPGYAPSDAHRKQIRRRLLDGADEALLLAIVDGRIADARRDMQGKFKNLNPATPFRDENWAWSQELASEARNPSRAIVDLPERAPPVIDGEPASDEERTVWLETVRRTGKIGDGHSAVIELRSKRGQPRAIG